MPMQTFVVAFFHACREFFMDHGIKIVECTFIHHPRCDFLGLTSIIPVISGHTHVICISTNIEVIRFIEERTIARKGCLLFYNNAKTYHTISHLLLYKSLPHMYIVK